MKTLKKSIASLALAAMLLPTWMPVSALAQGVQDQNGPLMNYADCVVGCVEKYDQWTWGRTICAIDCYIKLIKDLTEVVME
jgi:hypothetical protein